MQLIVQSGHRGPAFLDDRVESFLGQYRTELAGYSEEMLGGFVEAVCEKLTEKPKNIDQVRVPGHSNTFIRIYVKLIELSAFLGCCYSFVGVRHLLGGDQEWQLSI